MNAKLSSPSLLLTALLCLGLGSVQAQNPSVPSYINYQGSVTDSDGLPIGATGTPQAPVAAPTNRKMIFRIYDSPTGPTNLLWTEEQTVTISLGQFSVLLGRGIQFDSEPFGSIESVFTSNDGGGLEGPQRFLSITVDDGDSTLDEGDVAISPRQQITTTAYSFRAQLADRVEGVVNATGSFTATDGSFSGNVGIQTSEPSVRLHVDGGNTGGDDATLAGGGLLMTGREDSMNLIMDPNEIMARNNGVASTLNLNIAGGNVKIGDETSKVIMEGGITGGSFNGNGAALTALNASNISTGTLDDGRLTNNVALLDRVTQSFTGATNSFFGNVGIQTSEPSVRLHVDGGNTGGDDATLAGGGLLMIGRENHGNLIMDTNEIMARNNGFASTLNLNIAGGDVIIGNDSSSIVTRGVVGIGRHSANAPLHIESSTGQGIRLDEAGASTYWDISYDSAATYNANDLLFLYNGTSIGARIANGDGSYNQLSDRRAKRDFEHLKTALAHVERIPVMRFRYKDASSDTPKSYGYIAQDVEQEFPDLVSQWGDGMKGLSVTGMIPINTRAIQELKAEKDAEIAARDEKIADLEDRLARLEAMMAAE